MTARATIPLEHAARERWDAVVIGAGPAGSLAARGLAQRQFKTLLVDRKAFPRSKVCGACISLRALSLLNHAGLETQIAELPGVPLSRAEVLLKSRVLRVSLPGGVVITRAVLDEALVKSAMAQGVHFLPNVTAAVRPQITGDDPQTRRLELAGSQGGSFVLESSAIVAADGLGHPSLRACPEFADRVRLDSRMGLAATFAASARGFDRGRVTMSVGRSGYIGAVRLNDGQLHLAAAIDPAALRSVSHPAELVSQIFKDAKSPAIPELWEADWQGTLPLTRCASSVAGGRVFLVGDAAGYVEPFTGEGIAWALATGMAVPVVVAQALGHNTVEAEHNWRAQYRQFIHHRQDWCRFLGWVLRRPRLFSAAAGLMSLAPVVPQFVVNQLNQPRASAEWDLA